MLVDEPLLFDSHSTISYGIYLLAYENTVVTTRSHPDAFPSVLKLKRTTQTLVHESADLGTKVRNSLLIYWLKYDIKVS